MYPCLALIVICCETAMRPDLEPKQTCLARAQNVADDPEPTWARVRQARIRK